MKRYFVLFVVLMAVVGAKAQQTWDFTQEISSDVAALNAATTEWSYDGEKNRFESKKAIDGVLKAGNTELELTKGLKFKAAEKKIRIDVAKRVQLAGKNVVITIPALKKGQTVTVVCVSTGDTPVTLDELTNLSNMSGLAAADKNTTQTGTATVTQDGDVTLACSVGSINIISISVSEAPEGGSETGTETGNEDEVNNNVPMNLNQNQAILTLQSNDVKYYNTDELASIDIEDQTNKVTVNTLADAQDVFNGSVKTIAFSKAAEQGEQGDINNGGVEITESKGWFESLYAKWKPFEGATNYNVYIKGGKYSDWTKIDQQLVRNYGTYIRADVVGLMADSYSLKVVPVTDNGELTNNASEVSNIDVVNYKREGYAFFGRGAGVGAYNNDGTLKANAVVLYVTNSNFNTIQCEVNVGKNMEKFTGLGNILKAMEKGKETRPFAIRFIGEIKVKSVDAAQLMGDKSCLNLKGNTFGDEQNVTYEGIGDDATMNGIGFRFNRAGSVEVRNLGIMNHADDCFEFTQCVRVWVHNMDLFYGNAGSDADQAKGDGTLDLKKGTRYCTFDNNHFWDCGKASLCGLKGETTADYATYHHNWFDHADSRMPRVRVKTIHIYNNYYDGVSKYGVGSTQGSSIFVERNYFRNTKFPMMISLQGNDVYAGSSKYDPANYGTFSKEAGGMIKAYNNIITGQTTSYWPYKASTILTKGSMVAASSLGVDTQIHFDCYEVEDISEKVPGSVTSFNGGNTYNNFDTDPDKMYSYDAEEPADVPTTLASYYGCGRLNHGDFSWTFDNAKDDTDYEVNTQLKQALNSYKTKLVSIFGDVNAASSEEGVDDGTGSDTGDNGDTTDDGTDDPADGDDEVLPGETISGTIECSFEDKKPSNTAFSVSGSYSNSKGSVTYNGKTYGICLKIESSTLISFTTTEKMKLTMVFDKSEKNRNILINGNKVAIGTDGFLETVIDAGSYDITKDSVANLFYIKLEPVE